MSKFEDYPGAADLRQQDKAAQAAMAEALGLAVPREPEPEPDVLSKSDSTELEHLRKENLQLQQLIKLYEDNDAVWMGERKARFILAAIANLYGVGIKDILGPSRLPSTVRARYQIAWEIYKNCDLSYSQIGRILCRDHSTILYAVRRCQTKVDNGEYVPMVWKDDIQTEMAGQNTTDDRC